MYCNFFSVADMRRREDLTGALHEELSFWAARWPHRRINTVYFGGGTPSLLPPEDIEGLLSHVRAGFDLAGDAEITLEANPEDVSLEKAAAWMAGGVNRFSLGVQSFDDSTLAYMRRRHSGRQAVRAIEALRAAGCSNVTLDLIYGVPGRDDAVLAREVDTVVALGVQHVSAYALTREKGTALDVLAERGQVLPPDDDMAARQYLRIVDRLAEAGIFRYEVSNFARPGFHSRHNSAYWDGTPYLGIGPSAHSFDGCRERRWNVASVEKYIRGAGNGEIPCEREVLSRRDLRNEMVMTALRTDRGLSLAEFERRFGAQALERLRTAAEVFLQEGRAQIVGDALRITRAGWFFADGIACELFEVD